MMLSPFRWRSNICGVRVRAYFTSGWATPTSMPTPAATTSTCAPFTTPTPTSKTLWNELQSRPEYRGYDHADRHDRPRPGRSARGLVRSRRRHAGLRGDLDGRHRARHSAVWASAPIRASSRKARLPRPSLPCSARITSPMSPRRPSRSADAIEPSAKKPRRRPPSRCAGSHSARARPRPGPQPIWDAVVAARPDLTLLARR